jgi:nucleoside-diphosphate-sugar epimerase
LSAGCQWRYLPAEECACRPESVYGHAKLAATNYLLMCMEKHALQVNILRVFNLVSPVNSTSQVLGAFIERAMAAYDAPSPRTVTVGRLDAIRDFVSVFDLLQLLRRIVEAPASEPIINVCSGVGHRVRDLIIHLNEISGRDFQITEVGPPPRLPDSVIGDPTKFLKVANLSVPRPVHAELADAWELAVSGRRR